MQLYPLGYTLVIQNIGTLVCVCMRVCVRCIIAWWFSVWCIVYGDGEVMVVYGVVCMVYGDGGVWCMVVWW